MPRPVRQPRRALAQYPEIQGLPYIPCIYFFFFLIEPPALQNSPSFDICSNSKILTVPLTTHPGVPAKVVVARPVGEAVVVLARQHKILGTLQA